MLTPDTLAVVNGYWAADIGCLSDRFGVPGVVVAPPHDPSWRGVFVFVRNDFTHISAPDDLRGLVAEAVAQPNAHPLNGEWWRELLAGRLLRAIGPAFVGYADEGFTPVDTPAAMMLLPVDEEALRRFQERVGATAWEHSGLEGPQPRAGCWEGAELAAVAGYHRWGERIAHIGVASDPMYRGRGYGKAAVSAIGRYAQAEGLVLQYRTLLANTPSVAVAAALGFEQYATTLALRVAT